MSSYAGPSPAGWGLRASLRQVRTGEGRATVRQVLESRGLRQWVFGAGIWLIYVFAEIPEIARQPWPEAVLSSVLLLGFCAIYVFAVPFAFANFRIVAWLAPVGMLALYLAFLPIGGADSVGLAVYVGVALVVCWPRPFGIVALGVLSGLVALLPQTVPSWDVTGPDWGSTVPLVLGSLVAYAFVGLQVRNYQLKEARGDIVRLAAEQERSRIARDMHDVLGHTLTTVTVKASLAQRVFESDPARAAAEMHEVELLARQGLADVRAVLAGYREVSVGAEIAAAREVLRAADITADLPPSADIVRPELNELFGWVVREGVTNVVRHSGARTCTVRLECNAVEVIDDGTGLTPGGLVGGQGLGGIRERAEAAGAVVHAGTSGGGFRLRVEVPA